MRGSSPDGWRIAVAACLLCATTVQAEEISARASVSQRHVALGEGLQLRVTIAGAQNVPPPEVSLEGFLVQYLGPSTSVSVVNGVVSSSVTHSYSLMPQQEGHFTIGPIAVDVGGRQVETQPIAIDVGPQASSGVGSAPGAQPSTGRPLRLQLAIDKPRAVVNEAIPARVQLLVGRAGVRGIEMPTLKADGFLVKPFGQPTQSEVVIDGESWTLVEFQTTVVPIRAGTLSLGPASLTCQVVARRWSSQRRSAWPFGEDPLEDFFGSDSPLADFFGQQEVFPMSLNADPVTLDVQPLPSGQPAEFSGAVGRFTMDVKTVPTDVAVGEPITITTTIGGEGNFDTVTPPQPVLDPTRWKIYEPTTRQSTGQEAALNQKVFEQVVIPLDPSIRELPPIRFSYYDPASARYEMLSHGPTALSVRPAASHEPVRVVESPQPFTAHPTTEPEALGRDIVYIKEHLGAVRRSRAPWYASPWWLLWQLVPVALLAISEALRYRHERLASDPGAARMSGALKRAMARCQSARRLKEAGKAQEFYAEIFRTIQGYVGDRCNLSSEGLTRLDLERHLAPRGVPEELLRALLELFERCDAARFAPASLAAQQMDTIAQDAESLLKRLERWKLA